MTTNVAVPGWIPVEFASIFVAQRFIVTEPASSTGCLPQAQTPSGGSLYARARSLMPVRTAHKVPASGP
jgi:hypothetical protein